MKTTKHARRGLSLLLVAALMLVFCIPSFAVGSDITPDQEHTQGYTYEAPTSPMAVDDNIITATAHRAASPILGMMGVNATSGFGMINGGAPADFAEAQECAALGIWGSSLNENPDPYYWNYFYNFYASETEGVEVTEDALINNNAAASPVGADGTLVEEYGNISVSLCTRPDIAVGCASTNSGTDTDGYNDQLATIHSFTPDSPYYQPGDETYSPKLVSYQTTYIKQMIESVYRLADAIEAVEAETGKTTRYGDVQIIAGDYEKYVYGIIAYVQEELAAKGLPQKTVAVVTAINEDGTYTIADSLSTSATSLVRAYEYAMPVSNSLTDVIGGTTATLEQLLTADVISTLNNQNITQDKLLESFGSNVYDGIIIASQPATLYGITMNSVENAMGYAYEIGCMYSDILNIDPVELCAYFYEHFWHISDLGSLETVVKTNFSSTILPDGVSATLPSTYSAATIEAKLAKGMEYYRSNPAAFQTDEYDLIGMSSWDPDTTAGIGAGTSSKFTDVPAGSYFAEPVAWAVEAGITSGATATEFDPNTDCSRAMAMTFLWRAAGCPEPESTVSPFTDVQDSSSYYYKAVLWAVESGITEGTSKTRFSPDDPCSRAQIVTFLWRTAGCPAPETVGSAFKDVQNSSEYYYNAVLWAVENGITEGNTSTTFAPTINCNRAMVVTFLYRNFV